MRFLMMSPRKPRSACRRYNCINWRSRRRAELLPKWGTSVIFTKMKWIIISPIVIWMNSAFQQVCKLLVMPLLNTINQGFVLFKWNYFVSDVTCISTGELCAHCIGHCGAGLPSVKRLTPQGRDKWHRSVKSITWKPMQLPFLLFWGHIMLTWLKKKQKKQTHQTHQSAWEPWRASCRQLAMSQKNSKLKSKQTKVWSCVCISMFGKQ